MLEPAISTRRGRADSNGGDVCDRGPETVTTPQRPEHPSGQALVLVIVVVLLIVGLSVMSTLG